MIFKRISGRLININHIVEIKAVLDETIMEKVIFGDFVKEMDVFVKIELSNNKEVSVKVLQVNINDIIRTEEFEDLKTCVVEKYKHDKLTNEDIVSTSIFEYFNTYLKEKYENDFVQKYIEGER